MQAPEVPVLIIKQQKQNWCTDDNNKMYLAVISFTQAIHSAKSCPFRSITGLSLKCFTMLCQRVKQWGPMTWHWAISQYNEGGPHPQQQKPQQLWKVSREHEPPPRNPQSIVLHFPLSWQGGWSCRAERQQQGGQSSHWYGHMCSTLSDLNSLFHRTVYGAVCKPWNCQGWDISAVTKTR